MHLAKRKSGAFYLVQLSTTRMQGEMTSLGSRNCFLVCECFFKAEASVIKCCSFTRKNVCLLFHHPLEAQRKKISTSVVIMTG